MEAKDLRIGNYIYDDYNEVHRVEHVSSKDCKDWNKQPEVILSKINGLKGFYQSNDVFPIPLTEEWLYKFGFQKEDEGSVSVQFHYGENPVTKDYLISLIWIKDYKSNNDALEGFPFYRNGHFTIKTVHHLQNLIFALSGEELTLTETPCPEKE